MNKVLIITGILPVSAIRHKKIENDILLVTEDEIIARYPDISFKYIFVFPLANKILANFSSKWNSYYELSKRSTFTLRGRNLILLPVILLPQKTFYRNLLVKISLYLHRKRIDREITEYQPTIFHAQNADIDAFIARMLSKRYNIPYIVTLRDLNERQDRSLKRNLNKAKSLVAVSQKQMAIGEGLSKNIITFLPHGVKESFYGDFDKRRTVKFPIRLITVARLLKWKNIDLIVRTLAKVQYEYVYDIYGDGPEKEIIQHLILSLGLENRIRLRGFVKNDTLPTILQQYDLFVMVSYPETLGRVYFEAMASGLSVIASKDTGIDGIVTNGCQGYLVDHRSEVELQGVLELIGSNPDILLENAVNASLLAQNYRWENISKIYHDLYVE